MKLRVQLLLLSVSILVLPWSGCQFIKNMEVSQRQAQLELAQAKAQLIAQQFLVDESSLATLLNLPVLRASMQALNIAPAKQGQKPVLFDGELADDWRGIAHKDYLGESSQLQLSSALQQEKVYLALNLEADKRMLDDGYVKFDFHLKSGERIRYKVALKALPHSAGLLELDLDLFSYDADILLSNLQAGVALIKAYGVRGFSGAQFEFEIDQQVLNELQLDYLQLHFASQSSIYAQTPKLKLKHQHRLLAQKLEQANVSELSSQVQSNLHILDRDGFKLASDQQIQDISQSSHQLWQAFYKAFLGEQYFGKRESIDRVEQLKKQAAWYELNGQSMVRVVQPIEFNGEILAYLVLEQSQQAYLNQTENAFGQLLLATLFSSLVVALGLVLYASFLSFRIRKLSQMASAAVDDNGAVKPVEFNIKGRDELADLARSYQRLLHKVSAYNSYLQSLGGKLSHELKTPLAIIKSSLDNLEHSGEHEPQEVYLARAQSGAQRLSAILAQLSSASRIENSIEVSQTESIDLIDLLEQLILAYRASFNAHIWHFEKDVEDCQVMINAELFVQMLDKLADNARDFCLAETPITFALSHQQIKGQWRLVLSVRNQGPLLPTDLDIFDSLVSQRQDDAKGDAENASSHLGLGLYIVKLIADFHQLELIAENTLEQDGVVFKLIFPGHI